jgi:NTP pyrophosphatase (non-canonical NTP hydrolase)
MELKDLQNVTRNFINDRDWRKFQTAKDLAEDTSVEAGELLELFLWKNGKEFDSLLKEDPALLKKVKNETSDVLFGCLAIADHLNFDLEEAFISKMEQLNKRYKIDEVKGKSVKIDEKEWLSNNVDEN